MWHLYKPAPDGGNAQVAQILAQLLQLQQQNQQCDNEEEKKDDEVGFAMKEWKSLCQMCGKQINSNINTLPQWIEDILNKSVSESYKMTIICKHIMDNEFYNDSKVLLTSTLLKNVAK
jgi:hypothetical protein